MIIARKTVIQQPLSKLNSIDNECMFNVLPELMYSPLSLVQCFTDSPFNATPYFVLSYIVSNFSFSFSSNKCRFFCPFTFTYPHCVNVILIFPEFLLFSYHFTLIVYAQHYLVYIILFHAYIPQCDIYV